MLIIIGKKTMTATIIIFLVFLTTAVVLNYAVKPSATQEEPEVAAADQPVQETVPPGEEQRVIPVTSDGQPMQSGAGTAAPSQAYITTPEGDAGPEIQVITDPEMLKMLEAGQDPASATPTSEPQPKPKEESTPPAEPPATGEGGDGGR